MTLGALVDCGADLEAINAAIGSLGLPDCRLVAREVKKHGFRATQVTVEYRPEHTHRHLSQILRMIEGGSLGDRPKDLAGRVFGRLAEAEAHVHGTTIEKVHFHEVGAADSIADIVGSAVALDLLGVERVAASAVPTGCGQIRIAHGVCSVPAPATAELLKGIPLAESTIANELTTPTGAALLAALADSIRLHGYSPEPMTKAEAAGFYGQLFANLDDIHLDVEQVVEEGDTLAVHAVMSGTHTGELFGLTNTGVRIEQQVMTMLRFVDGRCVQRWSVADTLGVMAQIGALPQPA